MNNKLKRVNITQQMEVIKIGKNIKEEIKEIMQNDKLDLLTVIYNYAEEDGEIITKKFREQTKNIHIEKEQKENTLKSKINQITDIQIKREIQDAFFDYVDADSEIIAKEEEQYFKEGFRYGISIMMQSVK